MPTGIRTSEGADTVRASIAEAGQARRRLEALAAGGDLVVLSLASAFEDRGRANAERIDDADPSAITLIALNEASAAPSGRGFVRQEIAQASAMTPPKNIP